MTTTLHLTIIHINPLPTWAAVGVNNATCRVDYKIKAKAEVNDTLITIQ